MIRESHDSTNLFIFLDITTIDSQRKFCCFQFSVFAFFYSTLCLCRVFCLILCSFLEPQNYNIWYVIVDGAPHGIFTIIFIFIFSSRILWIICRGFMEPIGNNIWYVLVEERRSPGNVFIIVSLSFCLILCLIVRSFVKHNMVFSVM